MRGLFDGSFEWDMQPVEGYPTFSFNDTTTDSPHDIEFQYNLTGTLGFDPNSVDSTGYVKYLDFALLEYDCDRTKAVDPGVLTLSEANGQTLNRILQASNDEQDRIALFLSMNRNTIVDSPYYEDGPDGTSATVQFCLRGDYMYDADGNPGTPDDSINFHETQVTITIDLTAGFELVALNVVRDGAADASANIACEVQAYFCNDSRQRLPAPFLSQGMPLEFCVEIAEKDRGRLWLRDIIRTELDQDNEANVYRSATNDEWDDIIVNFRPDVLTEKDCRNGICRVKTQLKAKYFADRYPNPLDIFGTGLCALGSPAEGIHGYNIPLALRARTSIASPDGFVCDDNSMFTLNRLDNTTIYPKMMSLDGSQASTDCFLRLTPDEDGMRASSAFVEFDFFQSNPNKTFEMSAGYRIYGNNDGSADGMAFVIHADPRGANALGGSGGAMGVYGRSSQPIIKSALVIEWDTRKCGDVFDGVKLMILKQANFLSFVLSTELNREFFDDGQDRLHIMMVNEDGSITELAETGLIPLRTSEDGLTPGRIWVEYCDDQVLRVYLNAGGDEKPLFPSTFATVDLDALFQDNAVFAGFTAGTYALADNHDILDWTMTQSFDQCQAIPNIADDTDVIAMSHSELDAPDGFPCDQMLFTINRGTDPIDTVFPVSDINEVVFQFINGMHSLKIPVRFFFAQSYVPFDQQADRCFLRMTPDSAVARAASAFLDMSFYPENTEKSFSMSIGYRIYGGMSLSADCSRQSCHIFKTLSSRCDIFS
jgi:hypothetical protein